jgi:hypothetical protein
MYIKSISNKNRRNMRKLKEEFVYGFANVPMPKKDLRVLEEIRHKAILKMTKEYN